MSKILVVFGATGNQGGSVITQVLKHPELSKEYKIRAVTRDPSKATKLKDAGCEVVKGDLADINSVKEALKDAHTVFLVTISAYQDGGRDIEWGQATKTVDACVDANVQHIIFSSMTNCTKTSNGKYQHCWYFDVKDDIEQYIRKQSVKSSFFIPGSFYQNFIMGQKPRAQEDGSYMLTGIYSPDAKIPLIDIAEDTGKFIVPILENPEEHYGKVISAASGFYSYGEVAKGMSETYGKDVKYVQLSPDQFKQHFPPQLSMMAQPMVEMFQLIEEFGYYGADSRKVVKEGQDQASGKMTTLQEFLNRVQVI